MNIYELEKMSIPGPWFDKPPEPQNKLKRRIETKFGDRLALIDEGGFFDIGRWSASQGGDRAKVHSALIVHTRNNFIKAVDKIKQCRNYMCGNPEFGSCSLGLDEFIKELEEVN